MIFHALGFHHEESRYDRDDYVQINFGHVIKGLVIVLSYVFFLHYFNMFVLNEGINCLVIIWLEVKLHKNNKSSQFCLICLEQSTQRLKVSFNCSKIVFWSKISHFFKHAQCEYLFLTCIPCIKYRKKVEQNRTQSEKNSQYVTLKICIHCCDCLGQQQSIAAT